MPFSTPRRVAQAGIWPLSGSFFFFSGAVSWWPVFGSSRQGQVAGLGLGVGGCVASRAPCQIILFLSKQQKSCGLHLAYHPPRHCCFVKGHPAAACRKPRQRAAGPCAASQAGAQLADKERVSEPTTNSTCRCHRAALGGSDSVDHTAVSVNWGCFLWVS